MRDDNRSNNVALRVAAGVLLLGLVLLTLVIFLPDLMLFHQAAESVRLATQTAYGVGPLLAPLVVGSVMLLAWAYAFARGPLDQLQRVARALNQDLLGDGARDATQSALLDALEDRIRKQGPEALHDSWKEYRASAVERIVGEGTGWAATKRAADVLEDIAYTVTDGFDLPRIMRWGAAASITFGMLGTFVGITEGLGRIGPSGERATEVVSGLSSAFWTSIVGLIVALLVSILAGAVERELAGLERRLARCFERHLPPITVQHLLFGLLDKRAAPGTGDHVDFRDEITALLREQGQESARLAQTVSDLATRVSDRLVDKLDHLANTLSAPVTQAAEAGAKAVQETFAASLEPVREQFGVFADTVGQLSNDVRTLGDGVRESAMLARDVTEGCQQALSDATSRFGEVVGWLDAFQSVSMQLNDAQVGLQQALADFEVRAAELLGAQSSILEETHQAAEAAGAAAAGMQHAATSLTAKFDEIGEGVGRSAQAIVASEAALAHAADELRQVGDGLSALLQREQELLDATNARMAEITEAAVVVGSVSTDLARAVATLETALPTLASSATALDLAADALDDLPDATRQLAETTTAFRGSLEASQSNLSQQQDVAARWAKELQSTTEGQLQVYDQHLGGALEGLRTAVARLADVGDEFARIASELQEVDRSTGPPA